MKKLIAAVLIVVFALSACGNGELQSFTSDYNQSARKYDATELVESEFGKMETEDGESWKNLFDSKEYTIDALYDKNKVVGYSINVRSDDTSIKKDGKGYNAVLTLADALDLDAKKLEDGMQKGFNDSFYDYNDGDYNIRIMVINITSASMTITIERE